MEKKIRLLGDRDLDTGEATRPAEYRLADSAYAELATRLTRLAPSAVDPQLRANILAFFQDLNLPFATNARSF